jgi:hypothetical protein
MCYTSSYEPYIIALLLKMSEILSQSQGERPHASYMNSNECTLSRGSHKTNLHDGQVLDAAIADELTHAVIHSS